MNHDSENSNSLQLLMKNGTILPGATFPASELLGHQLLCNMNNVLSVSNMPSSVPSHPAPPLPSSFCKQQPQLTEYQLAKLRLSQELSATNSFYNFPYNYCTPYSAAAVIDLPKSGHSPLSVNGYTRTESGRYNRYLHDDPKPQHSYIGLIAMAILSMPDQKMVLADIYQYIMDNYPYFRNRGPGWRNSIRHNLSLNDCFMKSGRSANGKGHYWAIHPANLDDFKKGDFRRRKAQRKVRRHMGLSVPDDDDDDDDSPIPSPNPMVIADKTVDVHSISAAAAAAAAAANTLLAPNTFAQAVLSNHRVFGETHNTTTTTSSSSGSSSNSNSNSSSILAATAACNFSQQAFNFFNTLRFALPPPHSFNVAAAAAAATNFNENFYRQLFNLNVKQDLHTNIKSASNPKQFSIESLLSLHKSSTRSQNDSDADSESVDSVIATNQPAKAMIITDDHHDRPISSATENDFSRQIEPDSYDSFSELGKLMQPVNLKIN